MKLLKLTESELAALPGYLPPEKQHCVGCQAKLKPYFRYEWTTRTDENGNVRQEMSECPNGIYWWGGSPDCHSLFCTLRCAAKYAAYMFRKHGTELKGDK
jgi:hypothetical protein